MKNKILFTVTDLTIIDELKDRGITNFVYPLSFFCVGIPKTFALEEMKEENSFIYVNRVLDTKGVDLLKETLINLPSNIKGIIFDDLGLIEVLKNTKIIKILSNYHFNTNYASVNEYLKYVDDIIISPDITEGEITEIIAKANKKISLFMFGLVSALYSRRTLLSNYQKHHGLEISSEKKLSVNDQKFISIENEFGTVIYHFPYYNASRLSTKDVNYHFYFPILLDHESILKCAIGDFTDIPCDEGFLDKKTIYKVKERGN